MDVFYIVIETFEMNPMNTKCPKEFFFNNWVQVGYNEPMGLL
jgi:hypothetical protein